MNSATFAAVNQEWINSMYNLMVGFPDGTAYASRVLEYTDSDVESIIAPDGQIEVRKLMRLPTLLMPEIGSDDQQVVRVGRIENLVRRGAEYRFDFKPDPGVPEFSISRIRAAAVSLDIADFEFHRTHWAVKDVDLHRTLWGIAAVPSPAAAPPRSMTVPSAPSTSLSPRVFRLPTESPREQDLVAVMMPFDSGYLPVYQALQEASAVAGFRCQRADDMWINDHIMDDVLSLIWRARVVISDLTGKNANVFYETGIAHTIGRDVVLISQSPSDIPFDLRTIRTVKYLANRQGLDQLKNQVRDRLADLAAKD